MFISLIWYAQEKNEPLFQKKAAGTFYIGNGEYKVVRVGKTGFASTKKLAKKAEADMYRFASENKLRVEKIKVDEVKGGFDIY